MKKLEKNKKDGGKGGAKVLVSEDGKHLVSLEFNFTLTLERENRDLSEISLQFDWLDNVNTLHQQQYNLGPLQPSSEHDCINKVISFGQQRVDNVR